MTTGRLPSVEGGIQPTIVDAKGDLITATAADTVSRLAVGSNDQVLTADSTTATGLKWATPTAASPNYAVVGTAATSIGTNANYTFSGISNKDSLFIYLTGVSINQNVATRLTLSINADTNSSNYKIFNYFQYAATTPDIQSQGTGGIRLAKTDTTSTTTINAMIRIDGCNSAGVKPFIFIGWPSVTTGDSERYFGQGFYLGTSTVSSIYIASDGAGFDAGTITVYGA